MLEHQGTIFGALFSYPTLEKHDIEVSNAKRN